MRISDWSSDVCSSDLQPIVRLDTREIVGVEALCRLRTTDGEVVAASEFQEATSDVNVAAELTGRMLSIVAGDVRSWLDAGLPFQAVGVNVSTGDFYAGDLMRKLEHSFGRACVWLEPRTDEGSGGEEWERDGEYRGWR